MIINATTGTGFLGAISYIHKEHEKDFSQEQMPKILEENMVFGTVPEQAYLMRSIAIRNAKSSRPVLHLSISFHQEEIISEETRDLIFDKILEELGATRDNNQFIIAQHTHRTGYYKMENNQQDIPVDKLVFVAKHFGISVDDIIFFNEKNNVPSEVSMEDTAVLEQLKLINELDTEEKNILLKLIETFVSKKRFKDYLQKNIAAL